MGKKGDTKMDTILKNSRSLRRTALVGALLVSCAAPSLSWAADANATDAGVQEVIVTAQRRSESLQKVPVAVTVVSGDQLSQRQTFSGEQLVAQVPSLTFRKGTTNVNSALNIRGIGTISFSAGAEPAVSTVIDGVVLARSGQAFFDFFDVERIEVLRGPQGTLFGKNASAGVVSITTKAPSAVLKGFAEASYFDKNEYRARLGVSGPISDTLRGGITGVYGKYDGNVKNLYNNEWVNGYERAGVRGKLEWTPTSDLTVNLIADYLNGVDNASADIIGQTATGNAIIGLLSPVVPSPKNRELSNDQAPATKDTNWGLSASIDYKIADHTLTSITAYRGWGNTELRDGDYTSVLGRVVNNGNASRDFGVLDFNQISQEVRLASPTGQFLEYVVGAYYYHTDQDNYFNRYTTRCTATSQAGGACNGTSTYSVIANGTANFNTQLTNYAAFGQATLNFNEKLKGVVGLRSSHDEVKYDFARVSVTPLVDAPGVRANFASKGNSKKQGTSGRLGLQYEVSDTVSAYVNYARGYKGPAINVFFNMRAFDTIPLRPETSDAYEIGLKSKLFENRLVLNLAAFNSKYKGFQTTSFDTVAGTIVSRLINAGNVSTKGFEFDFTARPTAALTLSGGGAYTEAKIDRYNCPVGSPASCAAHDGQPLPYAPKFKVSAAADYLIATPDLPFDIGLNSGISWQDKTQFDIDQSPLAIQKAYGVWDASVSLIDHKDRYRVSLVGKNLTDQYYTSIKIPGGFVRQQVPRDAERYFGLTLRANFGG
jgi:iron complex outermembrane receptor protein